MAGHWYRWQNGWKQRNRDCHLRGRQDRPLFLARRTMDTVTAVRTLLGEWGWKVKKSYNRMFRKGGRSYYVKNCLLWDMESYTEKYYLTVLTDGSYRKVTDQMQKTPRFSSIREAHEYAEMING